MKKRKLMEPNWTWRVLDNEMMFQPDNMDFLDEPKIKQPLPAEPTPLDFVQLYFMEQVVDFIVTKMNRYAQQYIAKNIGTSAYSSALLETDRS